MEVPLRRRLEKDGRDWAIFQQNEAGLVPVREVVWWWEEE